MELSPLWAMIAVVSIPVQLLQRFIYDIGNFIVFDFLQLGPVLPISFGL